MHTTSITSKGQIVIPSAVRRHFGITEGTRFTVETDEAAGRDHFDSDHPRIC